MDGLSEWKNQWIEQYLRLVSSTVPEDWTYWLALASAIHNNWKNSMTGLLPNQILLGYDITLNPGYTSSTPNESAKEHNCIMMEHRAQAIAEINQAVEKQGKPEAQYTVGAQVWLEGKNLKLPYQSTKLVPKWYGPFKIIKEVSPVAYQLNLPMTWGIHDVFHTSFLSPYHETTQHGLNFSQPPPDLITGEEEYEVEAIQNHQSFRCSCALQYLIKWRGYPKSNNTWEPADNIHTPDLLKDYHRKHIKADALIARKLIPSHPGSTQIEGPTPQSTLYHPQVPQFCPWSSLSSNSCSLSETSVLLL
jgi:hypothetical protein